MGRGGKGREGVVQKKLKKEIVDETVCARSIQKEAKTYVITNL